MKKNNIINKSIIPLTKRINFRSSNFNLPLSSFPKFPIFLPSLLTRIKKIKLDYSINPPLSPGREKIFDLNIAKAKSQKELKNLGGVYILWCKKNGLFYVGSAIRFFTNKGRLSDYFMKNRVKTSIAGESSKINKNLAKYIDMYSIKSFKLIIVENFLSENLTKEYVQSREQL